MKMLTPKLDPIEDEDKAVVSISSLPMDRPRMPSFWSDPDPVNSTSVDRESQVLFGLMNGVGRLKNGRPSLLAMFWRSTRACFVEINNVVAWRLKSKLVQLES
jgi:hypothetical protein